MAERNSSNWSSEETRCLIGLWNNDRIKSKMEAFRKKEAYTEIADLLNNEGCKRTVKQVKTTFLQHWAHTAVPVPCHSRRKILRTELAKMATPTRDVPTLFQLYYIKDNAGLKWKDLARQLGFSEQDINVFEYKQMYRDPAESCMDMLNTWQQQTGVKRTTGILKEALEDAGLQYIADNLDLYESSYPRLVNYRTASDNELITEQEKQSRVEIQKAGIDSLSGDNLHKEVERLVEKCLEENYSLTGLKRQNEAAASTAVLDRPVATTSDYGGNISFEDNTGEASLRFHSKVHGFQVRIESNGTVARSLDSFNNSLCFSKSAVKVGEQINLKIIDKQVNDDSLRIGFTSRDPESMAVTDLPQQSYPDLAQRPRFWVKPLPGSQAHQGCVVTYSVSESGDVTFAVDGDDKGLFFSGVDVSKTLWAVVDVHGSAAAVQVVDEQAACEAFDQWIHEGDQVQLRELQREKLSDMQSGHGGFDTAMMEAIGEVGIVGRIDDEGDMHVFFPSLSKGFPFAPAALRKVKRPDIRSKAIFGGDLVEITTDLERLKSVQQEKNLWKDDMEKTHGKIGRVRGVNKDGDIAVRVADLEEDWIFNPQVVQKTETQLDMCGQGLHHWKRGVSKVCVKCEECTAAGAKCSLKGKPLRPPRSCCGCVRIDAGCEDCGLCKSCAGETSDEENILGLLQDAMLRPLEDMFEDLLENVIQEPNEYGLKIGDEVKVTVDRDNFKRLQEENKLSWDDHMEKVIGMPGKIVAAMGNSAVVRFQNERHIVFSGCLTKVPGGTQDEHGRFKNGDLVRLIKDEDKLKELQKRHGGYVDIMQQCLGKTGCVKKTTKRQVQVEFMHTIGSWWYSPAALTKVSSEDYHKTVHQLKTGDCVKVAVNAETLKANQLGHGGYTDDMTQVMAMETVGAVRYVDLDGDCFICFLNGFRHLVNTASLEKVNPEDYKEEDSSELKRKEWVKVDSDKARIKQVQEATATIPWDDGFYDAAGMVGQMETSIDPSNSVARVNISSTYYPLNSALLKRATVADMQEKFAKGQSSDFARGDLVKISVSLDELKSLQEEHGGYKADMEKVMDEPGSVCFIDEEDDVYVKFNLGGLFFNPAALTKVTTTEEKLCVGDLVQIESDMDRFKSLQTPQEHGGYVGEMAMVGGKTGRLLSLVDSKKVQVKVQGREWIFNPDLLRRIGNPRVETGHWKAATICAPGKHDWSRGRCLVCVMCGECTDQGKFCIAQSRPDSTPGSVAGCGDGHAGCDDCGCCQTCAGEYAEESDQLDLRDLLFSESLAKVPGGTQDEQGRFKKGDLVRLIKDEDKLKELQKGRGGYVDDMQSCLGKTGCVKKTTKRTVQVEFMHTNKCWWYSPAALTNVSWEDCQETVHQLKTGDCVKVAVDANTLKVNQLGHGGYVNDMTKVMETVGVVRYVDLDGDSFICFLNGFRRLVNPASLKKVDPEDFKEEDSSELKKEEWVKVDTNKARIKQVQETTASINWDDGFYAAAGKVGQIDSIDPSDKITRVNIIGAAIFPLNSALIKRATPADVQEKFAKGQSSDFARGDLVKISVSLDELKSMQEEHGGYKADMEKAMNKPGSVCFIDGEDDVFVRFNLGRLCFNPAALTKVTTTEEKLCVGDLVQIEADMDRFKSLQTPQEHGGYVEEMATVCGKTGRLLSFVDSKKIRVKVQGRAWSFNPDLLRSMGNPRVETGDWKAATICAPGKHDWSRGRCLVCVMCGECTDHGKLCFARGRPDSTPGSVAGCGDGHAGCDDCGCCQACSGEDVEESDLLESDEFKAVIAKTIQKTVKEEAAKRQAIDGTKSLVIKHRQSKPGGEVGAQREKLLVFMKKMIESIELIRRSMDLDSIRKVAQALNEHMYNPWFQSNKAGRKHLGDHLANIGAAEAFMEYGSFLSSEAVKSDDTNRKVASECLTILYGVINSFSHASVEFSLAVGKAGLLQMTVQELAQRSVMEESDANQEWIRQLVPILGNCARVAENKDYFRDIGTVDLLKKHLSNEDMVLKVLILSCLAHIVSAEETDIIQLDTEDTDFFVDRLNAAVDDVNHECKGFETKVWLAVDLVRDLTALACHEGNKLEFVKKGVVKPLVQLIESGNDTEKEYSMLCVQRFAMVDSIRETIVSETSLRVEEVLRALLAQGTTYAVQVAARKTLGCLKMEYANP